MVMMERRKRRTKYVRRKHLISFMAANQPKPERRIMRMEEKRMV